MSDDSDDKTEEPTGKRISKFREEGKIAQSRDIGGVFILASALILFQANGHNLYDAICQFFEECFASIATVPTTNVVSITAIAIRSAMTVMCVVVLPFAFLAVVIGATASIAQTGGNFTTKSLEPKFHMFNLVAGLRKVFFSINTVQQISLSLLKAIFLGIGFYYILDNAFPVLLNLAEFPLNFALQILGSLMFQIIIVGLIAAAFLAVADYLFSKHQMHKQMKMTKQEVKDEHKQMEGDPTVKKHIRQRMFEIGYNKMLSAATKSDVVVVNPTHYAVAIAYDPQSDGAPRLMAKGKDKVAAKIREIARKNSIPIVANPPVARSIYEVGKVGNEIPEDLYELVAGVLAYLYRVTGRAI